jgi:hypothetical protein
MENEPNEIESPIVELESSVGHVALNYLNTTIRTFKDTSMNHVEYRNPEGYLQGIMVPQDIMDILFEHEYPYRFDPVVDDYTVDWYVRAQAIKLEDELDEL